MQITDQLVLDAISLGRGSFPALRRFFGSHRLEEIRLLGDALKRLSDSGKVHRNSSGDWKLGAAPIANEALKRPVVPSEPRNHSTTEECHRHAIERARERYGVLITHDDCAAICELIRAGQATYKGRDAMSARARWLVHYEGAELLAVYDGRERRICTFLPRA